MSADRVQVLREQIADAMVDHACAYWNENEGDCMRAPTPDQAALGVLALVGALFTDEQMEALVAATVDADAMAGRAERLAGERSLYPSEAEAQRRGFYVPGYTELVVDVYFARRRNDADNALKLLLDVLKGRVMDDDANVQRIIVTKHIDTARPRVEVRIYPYNLSEAA